MPIALLLACAVACSAAPVNISDISQDEFLANRASYAIVLDVRRADEFAGGHVPGALNVPHDQLAARLPELGLDSDAPVVVYCRSGRRAGLAGSVLLEAGFTDVRHLVGDMSGWRESGRPIVQP
jgi:rhodanese-related sulfurtransferase